MARRSYLMEAIATMIGTIIGAGILGIPFVIAQAGFLTGLLGIIVIGFFVLMMYLYFGEVTLRTEGKHQMTGYAELYLGKWGRRFMTLGMMVAIYGGLIAYILGEGAAFTSILGGNPLVYQVGFLVVMGIIIYLGLRVFEESELLLSALTIIVIIAILVLSWKHVQPANLGGFNALKFFLPYGVILFAFQGMPAIPEVREELIGQEKHMLKAVVLGVLIPMVVYILFSLVVVGVVGLQGFQAFGGEQQVATVALGEVIGPYMVIFGNIFAILAMATSFLALSFAMMKMYEYDYKVKKNTAFLATMILPFVIAYAGFVNFIQVITYSGVIAGGIEGTLIVLMFWKAKKLGKRKPEYTIPKSKIFGIILIAVFIVGALLQFLSQV